MTFEGFILSDRKVPSMYEKQAKEAFDILVKPNNIFKMLTAVEMGIPPITPLVKLLESSIDCSNQHLRQIIGKEISYIMNHFGYYIDDNYKARTRVRTFSKAKYFVTSSVYKYIGNSKYKIKVQLEELN